MAIEKYQNHTAKQELADVIPFPKEKTPDWTHQQSGRVTYPVEGIRKSVDIGFSKYSPKEEPITDTETSKSKIFVVNGFSIDNGIKPMKRFCQELAAQCHADVYSIDTKPERFWGDPNDDEAEAVSRFIKDVISYSQPESEDPKQERVIIAGHSRGNITATKVMTRIEKEIAEGSIQNIALEPLVVAHYVDKKALPELVTNAGVDFARSILHVASPPEGISRYQMGKATVETYGGALKTQLDNMKESKIKYPLRLFGELYTLCKDNDATKEVSSPVILVTALDDPHAHPGTNSTRSLKDRLLGKNELTPEELEKHSKELFPKSDEVTVYMLRGTHILPIVSPKESAKMFQEAFAEARKRMHATPKEESDRRGL